MPHFRITLETLTASHLLFTAGSSRSFTATRKDAGLCCGSRLRKGEVFAYVGRNQDLKDLKVPHEAIHANIIRVDSNILFAWVASCGLLLRKSFSKRVSRQRNLLHRRFIITSMIKFCWKFWLVETLSKKNYLRLELGSNSHELGRIARRNGLSCFVFNQFKGRYRNAPP